MSISALGHFTIRCTTQKLPVLHRFYADVLGLSEGARPSFPFPGHWFYCGNKPIVHLYASATSDAEAHTGALDHIAFDAEGIGAARDRFSVAGIPFHERPIPGYALQQLFLQDPLGIKLELTFASAENEAGDEVRLSVNGTRIAFKVEGSGPALLLLHGGAGNLGMFDRLVPHLSRWYRVIRYDQRDCGDSEQSGRPYDFDALADDAVAVLGALDESKAHVLGTSFGGLLAQAIALRHPMHVDKLVLSSTWQLGVPFADMNPQISSVLSGDRTPDKLARAFFSNAFLTRHADAADFFRQMGSGMSEARAALLKQTRDYPVSSVAAKTLVVVGADDRIVPVEQSRKLAKTLRLGQLADPLPRVGHVSAFEDPEALARLVHAFCG